MKIVRRLSLPAIALAMLFEAAPDVSAQRATITFDQSFPVSPLPKYPEEYNDLRRIEDEANANTRLRWTNDFLSDYPDSEYRHLVMRMRFQTRYVQGDPEEIIRAAREALADEEYFFNTKLGFMEDPDSVPEVPAFRLDFANQKSIYHEAMMEAYRELEDVDNALAQGELALEAEEQVWTLFVRQFGEDAPEYPLELERHSLRQANILATLITAYQIKSDIPNELAYSRRFLEIRPDELDILMRVTDIMMQPDQMPQDQAALASYLEAVGDYATRAVDAVDALESGEAPAADAEATDNLSLVARANSSLGMVRYMRGEYPEAAEAFDRSAESVPDAQTYFLLGVAHNNSQNVDGAVSALARAVFLGFPSPQARQLLENAYDVKNGSLDGLDDFIQSEGAQIPAQ